MTGLFQIDVFVSGQDGYYAYRIPVIETAADGSLLAFAESRKYHLGDPGINGNTIDLVLKHSTDSGHTWSPMMVVEAPGELWAAANPSTVLDRQTGRIWLHYIRCRPGKSSGTAQPGTDDIQNLARFSDDNGVTWSEPMDITASSRDMADSQWRCTIMGPGGGIQDHTGRLILPCWKIEPWGVFAVFSDDHGKTWKRGDMVPGVKDGNEDQLVELSDGRILLDYRQSTGEHRWTAVSSDRGVTWSEPMPGQAVTPVCCAIELYTSQSDGADRNRIIWTGPKGPQRANLVARISYDDADSFTDERLIAESPAAYSDLAVLKDKSIGVLWERGDYRFITFTRLDRDFLESGR